MGDVEDNGPAQEYEGWFWPSDWEPATRFTVTAHSEGDARAQAVARFGTCPQLSVWLKEPDRGPGPLKEYVGIVWIGDEPGQRFGFWAHDSGEAKSLAKAEFGDHPMTIWNEQEVHERRGASAV